MVFELGICSDADIDRAFAIISSSFGHDHPYFDYTFPEHDTPAGRKAGADRTRTFKNSDPNTTYVKVTDTDTGTIVAVAKWNVYENTIPEELPLEGDYWPNETEKKLANEMWAGYLKPRRQAVREASGNIVCKSFFCATIILHEEERWC